MNDTNTTTKPGVLAVMDADGHDAFVHRTHMLGLEHAREHAKATEAAAATVERLVTADQEYDAALAAFNNTTATRPDWPQFHARFKAAKAQRAAALAAFNGE